MFGTKKLLDKNSSIPKSETTNPSNDNKKPTLNENQLTAENILNTFNLGNNLIHKLKIHTTSNVNQMILKENKIEKTILKTDKEYVLRTLNNMKIFLENPKIIEISWIKKINLLIHKIENNDFDIISHLENLNRDLLEYIKIKKLI